MTTVVTQPTPRVSIIWAAVNADTIIDSTVGRICQAINVKREEVYFEIADLARPKIPNAIIVVNDSFPVRAFFQDWQRYGIPFTAISIDAAMKSGRIPYSMCQSFVYIQDLCLGHSVE
jgi:hypothetical protein